MNSILVFTLCIVSALLLVNLVDSADAISFVWGGITGILALCTNLS